MLCTSTLDESWSLSPVQRHHGKIYAIGLVAACTKTVAGIAREILSANRRLILNKLLTECDWNKKQFNHEPFEELQKHDETRWSREDYIIIDDMISEQSGEEISGIARFYDHVEGDTVCDRDIIYPFYTKKKTVYPLTFRRYEQQNVEERDRDTKYGLARKIITEIEEEIGSPTEIHLFNLWFGHSSNPPTNRIL